MIHEYLKFGWLNYSIKSLDGYFLFNIAIQWNNTNTYEKCVNLVQLDFNRIKPAWIVFLIYIFLMLIYFFKRDSKNQNARVTIVLFFSLGGGRACILMFKWHSKLLIQPHLNPLIDNRAYKPNFTWIILSKCKINFSINQQEHSHKK